MERERERQREDEEEKRRHCLKWTERPQNSRRLKSFGKARFKKTPVAGKYTCTVHYAALYACIGLQ